MIVTQVFDFVFMLLEGGIVHQNVKLAVFLDRPLYRAVAERGVAHIARNQETAPTLAFDRRSGRVGVPVLIEIDYRNIGALSRIEDCDCTANTRIGASDKGNHVLELVGANVAWSFEERRLIEIGFISGLGQML